MAQSKTRQIGGSFAPPLSDEKLVQYDTIISLLPDRHKMKHALTTLLECCKAWWGLPESTNGDRKKHPVGVGVIQALDQDVQDALWDLIPWDYELAAMAELFETIDAKEDKELRNCAFHLLWHAKELELDREPLTNDKL